DFLKSCRFFISFFFCFDQVDFPLVLVFSYLVLDFDRIDIFGAQDWQDSCCAESVLTELLPRIMRGVKWWIMIPVAVSVDYCTICILVFGSIRSSSRSRNGVPCC
ncbi:unnamed protein product, partial [Pylaiella littoralis]